MLGFNRDFAFKKQVSGVRLPTGSVVSISGFPAFLYTAIPGVLLSVFLFFIIRGWEEKNLRNELGNLALERVEILQNKMLGSLEVLHSVAAFYSANGDISRHDFHQFVADARTRHPELQGLSWDPCVSDAQRVDFEAAARRDGFPNFKFSEMNAEGKLVAAGQRREYVPVYFEQPFEKNEAAMGFDLTSNPQRKAALDKARDTGQPAATMPIRLVQETADQMGFLVLMPIYRGAHDTLEQRRENLTGFASAVFRIGDLVGSAWKNLMRDDVGVQIVDTNAVQDGVSELGVHQTLNVAGATWDVFFRPTPRYLAAHSLRQSWAALAAGLMITTLLAAYVYRGMRRTAEIERRVAERTAELSNEVTERQRIEEALRKAEKKYRGIFENSIEGIFQTTRDGHYISANPALARIYGYASPAQLMAGLDDIGGKLYVDPCRRDEFMRIVKEHGEVSDFESQVRRSDGTVIWISEKARAVQDEHGAVLYYEGAVEDITERKRAAETLKKAHHELELRVAERTAELAKSNEALQDEIIERKRAEDAAEAASRAKSTFLAHMSHEIRTPLNAILGYAQILQRDQKLTQDQRRAVETIATSGNHLFGLIDDVLDISKIEAGRMELQCANFDLNSLIKRLESMFRHRCQQKGIRLAVENSLPKSCWIYGDEGKLRQVLINLLGNAVKFTESGEVLLKAGAQQNDSYLFEVHDTGIGIEKEEQAAVLQPFQQGSGGSRKGGSGLGLAISKRTVELMGGTLEFTSRPGTGSCFYFTVPLSAGIGASFAKDQSFLRLAAGSKVRALVVDDIAENRAVLSGILKVIGCEVAAAENGERAIEMARSEKPDIIFMDIWMSGMNGIEATQKILAEHGDAIKLVAHSASAFDHDQRRYLDAGFDDFFAKPFRSERLCECLKNLLHVHFETDESGAANQPTPEFKGFVLPDEFAVRLKTAAELYSMTEMKSCLGEIAQLGHDGRQFAEHLQRLADGYDMNAILDFLGETSRTQATVNP
jgi:PAS domain S-box-containing protein